MYLRGPLFGLSLVALLGAMGHVLSVKSPFSDWPPLMQVLAEHREDITANLSSRPLRPRPDAGPGTGTLSTKPGEPSSTLAVIGSQGGVWLNGTRLGAAPLQIELAGNGHPLQVELRSAGRATREWTGLSGPLDQRVVYFPPEGGPPRSWTTAPTQHRKEAAGAIGVSP